MWCASNSINGFSCIMNIKLRLMALGLTGALLTGGVFIATHEGQVNGTYIDPAGIITACFGHKNGTLQNGMSFTEAQCLDSNA